MRPCLGDSYHMTDIRDGSRISVGHLLRVDAVANPNASSNGRRAAGANNDRARPSGEMAVAALISHARAMPVALTFRSDHHRVLAERLAEAPAATIIGLCAAWCDTCREFRPSFERLADSRRDALFVWLDIEDDSTVVGDIDIENFPSLAVFRGGVPVFFGATMPQQGAVARLLAALTQGELAAVGVPDAVAALPRRLEHLAALAPPQAE